MAPSSFPSIDARKIRSSITRLPLATRLLLLALLGFYAARLFNPGLEQWGALIPKEMGLQSRTSHNQYQHHSESYKTRAVYT